MTDLSRPVARPARASDQVRVAYTRPNTFEIDLKAIGDRAREIRAAIGPSVKFFATLKADAYGFGLLPVAKTVLAAGADAISLVNLADAVILREAGIECPILVYAGSALDRHTVEAHERFRLMPTLYNEESLHAFVRYSKGPLDCAVKVDIGQARLGIPAEAAGEFIVRVAKSGKLRIAVVNAHPYVSSGRNASEALRWQFSRFEKACADAKIRGVTIPIRVLASSKVLRLTSKMNLEGIDPGQGLFASAQTRSPFHALRSELIQVKALKRDAHPDETPFPVHDGMRIGIVPIGYSDGLNRLNAGIALVRGQRVPILAQPSLEYTRLDLTGVPNACVGDEVIFIGKQAGEEISAAEVMAVREITRLPDLALEVKATMRRAYLPDA